MSERNGLRFVSCDPGKNGAFVVWREVKAEALIPESIIDIPWNKKEKKLDVRECREVIAQGEVFVIENVHSSPRQGVASAFLFGKLTGTLTGVAHGLGIEVVEVTPQRWKAGTGLIKKPKEEALVRAKELYPDAENQLKRKKDCDRADAILIGHFYYHIHRR